MNLPCISFILVDIGVGLKMRTSYGLERHEKVVEDHSHGRK
jgi:hypothetical protein